MAWKEVPNMPDSTAHLFAEAMSLSEEKRSELAVLLIDSLDSTTDVDAEAEWGEEIAQRLGELDAGTVRAVPWAEARRLIGEDEESDESTEPRTK